MYDLPGGGGSKFQAGHPDLSLEPLDGGTATGTYATAKMCLLVVVKRLGILGVTFVRHKKFMTATATFLPIYAQAATDAQAANSRAGPPEKGQTESSAMKKVPSLKKKLKQKYTTHH